MHRITLLLTLGMSGIIQPAWAEWTAAAEICEDERDRVPEVAIMTCRDALTSGKLTREEKAKTYANRGIAYENRGFKFGVAPARSERQGNYEQAQQDYQKALELDPSLKLARDNLAKLKQKLAEVPESPQAEWTDTKFCKEGQGDTAIDACTRLLVLGELTPEQEAWTYTYRGIANYRKGEFKEAIADYNTALHSGRLKPEQKVLTYTYRGIAFSDEGEFDLAIEDYKQALRNRSFGVLPGQLPWIYTNFGIAYERKGDYEQNQSCYKLAKIRYQTAVDMDRDNERARDHLIEIEPKLSDVQRSKSFSEGGKRIRPCF